MILVKIQIDVERCLYTYYVLSTSLFEDLLGNQVKYNTEVN